MCVASPFTLIAAPAPQGLNLLSEGVNYVRGDIFSPNPQKKFYFGKLSFRRAQEKS